jgi:TfoX/Sxy family transcriptional regulator of competence genes
MPVKKTAKSASSTHTDPELVLRLRALLADQADLVEKRMFGGLTFMVRGNMTVGVTSKGELMARVGADQHEKALAMAGARVMDHGGKSMVGFIFVDPQAVESAKELNAWVTMALKYNATLETK